MLSLTVSAQTNNSKQLIKELRIDFSNGSAEFSSKNKTALVTALKELNREYSSYSIVLSAQTDPLGNARVNQQVWQARIQSMSNFLVQQGFADSQFEIIPQNQNELLVLANPKEVASKRNVKAQIYTSTTVRGTVGGLRLANKHFEINTEMQQTVVSDSGTKINIPKNAFVDKNGHPIIGKVDLRYVEYRRPVDFILGGLPMDYYHNGEKYDFNSAGMFKITAHHKGVQVYLDPSKTIDMDFPLTADLPDLNFYQLDTISNKWTEISKLTKDNPVKENTITTRINSQNTTTKDTIDTASSSTMYSYQVIKVCDSVYSHIQLGIAIAKDTTQYHRYYNFVNEITMRKYKKEMQMNHIKIMKFGKKATFYQTLEESYHATYTFSPVVHSREGKGFKIAIDNSAANVKISKIIWIPESGSAFDSDDFYNRHWNIDKIIAKADKSYNIVLNDSLGKIELKNVKAFLSADESPKNRDYFLKYSVAKLNALALKKETADKGLRSNRGIVANVEKTNDKLKKYKLSPKGKELLMKNFISEFWKMERRCMSDNELAMTEEEWVAYFDSHKKEFQERFETLKRSPEYEQCEKVEKEIRIKQNELTAAYNSSATVVKQLHISSLGVYNCDQIRRLENPVEVIASYNDEKESPINPVFIYVVDSRLNGILRYDGHYGYSPYRFAFSPTAKTVLLAFDTKGDAYIYTANQFKSLTATSNSIKHQFSLSKIGLLNDENALNALIN